MGEEEKKNSSGNGLNNILSQKDEQKQGEKAEKEGILKASSLAKRNAKKNAIKQLISHVIKSIIMPVLVMLLKILLLAVLAITILGTILRFFGIVEDEDEYDPLTGFLASYAANFTNAILQLLMFAGDLALSAMQYSMVGVTELENYSGESLIQYSPGKIFLNQVAGLKVNFVGAHESDKEIVYNNKSAMGDNDEIKSVLNAASSISEEVIYTKYVKWIKVYVDPKGICQFDKINSNGDNGYYTGRDKKYTDSDTKMNRATIKDGYGMGVFLLEEKDSIYNEDCYESQIYSLERRPRLMAKYDGPIRLVIVPNPKQKEVFSRVVDFVNSNNADAKETNWYLGKIEEYDKTFPIIGENLCMKGDEDITIGPAIDELTTISDEQLSEYGLESWNDNYLRYTHARMWVGTDNFLYVATSFSEQTGNNFVNLVRETIFCIKRYNLSETNLVDKVEKESIAYTLQSSISKWYKGLRTLALVALLSILLYIGIRIVLSSTSAQDKTKYKAMIKDWIMALCILFILHYTMAFMLKISESLIEIIGSNVADVTLDGNTYDKLMSSVRNEASKRGGLAASASASEVNKDNAYILVYLVLVFLTFKFTFQYAKRVVFMAFLTMVAPVIALTYPLDKLKDGKAQAFSFWLKEYLVNCLIQPVHLLLYTVFVGSAFDFVQKNVLYAIVALAFLTPAEKLIREMFGLKAQTSQGGGIKALAGGVMLKNMLGKLKKSGGKGPSGASEQKTSPKTTQKNKGGANKPDSTKSKDGGKPLEGNKSSGKKGSEGNKNGTGKNGSNEKSGEKQSGSNNSNGKTKTANGKKNISGPRRLLSAGGKFAKNVATTTGGVMLAGAAGMASLAANIADGDLFENPGKALGEIGGSAAVGYGTGKAFTNKALTGSSSLYQKLKQARKK